MKINVPNIPNDTRREFIWKTGAIGAAALLAATPVLGANDRVRIGND